jgi:transcriptional regulator with XRE-family HTH domain
VAPRLGVTTDTYLLWERDRTKPEARYYPRIFAFLGYNPLPPPTTLGDQLKHKRLELGLTLRAAARLIGANEGTLARWETGEWKPRMSRMKVDAFLAMQPDTGTVAG